MEERAGKIAKLEDSKLSEVCPFRGIRYNERIVRDLGRTICPPYDIITPEQQEVYYKRSDYNAIRLEYGMEQPGDNAESNKYTRAAITFQRWLEDGVLQFDNHPAFYLHDHYFDYLGKERVRRGLIAQVKLEPWGNGIYPHEETFSKAKSDRIQLMRACQANFSPLFSLYQDPEQEITSILAEASQVKPIIEISVPSALMGEGQRDGGERHIVWAITNSKFQQQIKRSLAAQPVYMADGHHRYETALDYQRERAQVIASRIPEPKLLAERRGSKGAAKQSLTGKEAFDYIMIELVDFSDPGLVVLPIHRLVRGISPSVLARLRNQIENFFTLEFVPLTKDSFAPCHCERSEAISKMIDGAVLAVLGLAPESLVFLKQRRGVPIGAMMPGNRSQAYREFDVSLLNHVILDKMLGLAQGSGDIAYTVNRTEAYQQIREGKYQLAFLLNPSQPEIVKAVADAKDRMPRKSTYFYPKLPAGLIINPLD